MTFLGYPLGLQLLPACSLGPEAQAAAAPFCPGHSGLNQGVHSPEEEAQAHTVLSSLIAGHLALFVVSHLFTPFYSCLSFSRTPRLSSLPSSVLSFGLIVWRKL